MSIGRGIVAGIVAFVAGVIFLPRIPNAVLVIGALVVAWLAAQGGHTSPSTSNTDDGPRQWRREPASGDAVIQSHRTRCEDCGARATILVYQSGASERLCDRCGRTPL